MCHVNIYLAIVQYHCDIEASYKNIQHLLFRPIMLTADTVNKTPHSYQMKWTAYNKSIFTLDKPDSLLKLNSNKTTVTLLLIFLGAGRLTYIFSQ